MLMGHKCVPCNASKFGLDSKGNLRDFVGRATAGKSRGLPDLEEAVHGVDLGDQVVLPQELVTLQNARANKDGS